MFLLPNISVSYTAIALLCLFGSVESTFAAPPNPVVAYSMYKAVTLKWTPVAQANRYAVCYSSTSFTLTCPNQINITAPQTELTITHLMNQKNYRFRVLATDSNNTTIGTSKLVYAVPRVGKLNDTGIINCANNNGINDLPCPVLDMPGQDAQYGRDSVIPSDSDGAAGFSFTKIGSKGGALPATATNWNCVRDNVTGLLWEVKTVDGGLHDKNWTYSWYEADNTKNGGYPGYPNFGSCEGSLCDTAAYVQAVNAAGWCGHNDWRLPTNDELLNITDLSRANPSINTSYFPNSVKKLFWSSSPSAQEAANAWCVDFKQGKDAIGFKGTGIAVRLVRGQQWFE